MFGNNDSKLFGNNDSKLFGYSLSETVSKLFPGVDRPSGFISRSVKNRSAEVILKLYLTLVRPHLVSTLQFWSPYYRMDIGLLEMDDQDDTGDS